MDLFRHLKAFSTAFFSVKVDLKYLSIGINCSVTPQRLKDLTFCCRNMPKHRNQRSSQNQRKADRYRIAPLPEGVKGVKIIRVGIPDAFVTLADLFQRPDRFTSDPSDKVAVGMWRSELGQEIEIILGQKLSNQLYVEDYSRVPKGNQRTVFQRDVGVICREIVFDLRDIFLYRKRFNRHDVFATLQNKLRSKLPIAIRRFFKAIGEAQVAVPVTESQSEELEVELNVAQSAVESDESDTETSSSESGSETDN